MRAVASVLPPSTTTTSSARSPAPPLPKTLRCCAAREV
jgi:hypothetical protein